MSLPSPIEAAAAAVGATVRPPATGSRRGKAEASRRYRRLGKAHGIGLNIIPLVDVTFLLMIFFVIAGSFEVWEGVLSSRLARADKTAAVPLPISPIVVRLAQAGPAAEDYTIRIENFSTAPPNPAALTDAILQIHQQPGFDQQTPVIIAAGNQVRWDHVVGCWNAAVRAGCRQVVFGEP